MNIVTNEAWRDVPGYEEFYQVSSGGLVWSLRTGRWVAASRTGRGYMSVTLFREGRRARHFVHRLVASAFLERSHDSDEVNHKNGDKADNRAENLEWVSRSENARHAFDTGLRKPPGTRGERINTAKLTEDGVRMIRARRALGETIVALAAEFAMSTRQVSDICNRKAWTHVE